MSRRVSRGNLPAGFAPPMMGGLLAWWRADAGITTATGVSAWADLSGNGNTVTQATGSAQPTYNASSATFGARPSLTFVAASSQALANASFNASQPDTIYIVGAFSVAASTEFIDGTTNRQILGQNATTNYEQYAGTSVLSGGITDTNAHAICGVFADALSATAAYVDNSRVAVISGSAGTSALTGISVGGVAGGFLSGSIAEVIIYSGSHNATNRGLMFAYIANRYGLAVR